MLDIHKSRSNMNEQEWYRGEAINPLRLLQSNLQCEGAFYYHKIRRYKMGYQKYKPYPQVDLKNRQWPDKIIEKAPIWCSVDLRDGNQALPTPMGTKKKLEYFKLLSDMGFKEIEIAFPSASQTDYDFTRTLIDNGLVLDDMTVQVLTQSREHLIRKTYEALEGYKQAIVHFYLSTSTEQRRVVFKKSKQEMTAMAVEAAKLVKNLSADADTDIRFEFSPESFTGTEMDYALEVCEEVTNIIQPTKDKKLIINIPATVEMSTPNVFADQIEWFASHMSAREETLISIHSHNDRGTGVASTELAVLAGADRVEGTLFGGGERTGNADILTLAMNLYSRGIDPELNITDINHIKKVFEECTEMRVPERHPYAGELVYTAFSGSHQDAIRKGLKAYEAEETGFWEVPYLPIDPADIGRQYEPIIRINSQSGKGGIAYIMEQDFGYQLPKPMHPEFAKIVQKETDDLGRELAPKEIMEKFKNTYFDVKEKVELNGYSIKSDNGNVSVEANIIVDGIEKRISGNGNGPISAFYHALTSIGFDNIDFKTYEEHALSSGEDAEAVAYIELLSGQEVIWGVGQDKNTTTASYKAILCAVNRQSA